MDTWPETELFPMMTDGALAELAAKIRTAGLLVPIVVHQGKILDGRNRYRACQIAGVEPKFVEWDGSGGSRMGFVIAMNLDRRHLTPEQRAALAVNILPELEKQRKVGRPAKQQEITQKIAEISGEARQQAAAMFHVNILPELKNCAGSHFRFSLAHWTHCRKE